MDYNPKRRKHKDNPYTLMIENNVYFVLFKDVKDIIHKIEVSKEVFNLFDSFELEDKKVMNEYDRHIEHSELCEITLNNRAVNKLDNLEDNIIYLLEQEKLKESINNLTNIEKRRIQKYFFENKTYEQIGKEEECTKRAVKFSIDNALEKISKKFKN